MANKNPLDKLIPGVKVLTLEQHQAQFDPQQNHRQISSRMWEFPIHASKTILVLHDPHSTDWNIGLKGSSLPRSQATSATKLKKAQIPEHLIRVGQQCPLLS